MHRKPPAGYEVVRIHFQDGLPVSIQPFVTGFVTPQGEHGRIVGNAIAKDGSLLFTDDLNGVIYRVSYAGGETRPSSVSSIPDEPMKKQNQVGVKSALAIDQLQTREKLTVSSPYIQNGGSISPMYSAYDQNASPTIEWTVGPTGTQSYALIMEDPDAAGTPLPVIHWVAWNIPAAVRSLHEGLPALDQLDDPKGMRQGPNTPGTVGYKGPRPPAGDPPHHYHLQVFAVDRMLDLLPGANRDDLLAALKGHVLASGELVATFARPDHPAKP